MNHDQDRHIMVKYIPKHPYSETSGYEFSDNRKHGGRCIAPKRDIVAAGNTQ